VAIFVAKIPGFTVELGTGHMPDDGFVIGCSHGIYYSRGDAVLGSAIRDEAPLIAPYPDEFYRE
jgi:hypothetical protein